MTFNALKRGNVSKIDWMFEGGVGLVTTLALAIGETSQIDWMLYVDCFDDRCGPRRIRQNRVADVAVIGKHFPRVTDVLAIMAPKTTR